MSQIESGQRQVKAYELAAIAQTLRVSPIALLDPDSFSARLSLAGRSDEGAPFEDGTLLRLVRWLGDMQPTLDRHAPRRPMSLAPREVDLTRDWVAAAEALANEVDALLGQEWRDADDKLQMLKSAIEERLHIDVIVIEGSEDDLLGVAVTSAEMPLIVVNSRQIASRAVFTMAHELGHVLSSASSSGLIADATLQPKGSPVERFANAFAAALFLPLDHVRQALAAKISGEEKLKQLLETSGASWQTLTYRLHNLGVIDSRGRDQLLRAGAGFLEEHFSKSGDGAEFLSELRARPIPSHRLTLAALLAAKAGELSARAASQLAILDESTVEKLLDPPLRSMPNLPEIRSEFRAEMSVFDEVPA